MYLGLWPEISRHQKDKATQTNIWLPQSQRKLNVTQLMVTYHLPIKI